MRKWSAIVALSSLLLALLASGFILLAPCFVRSVSVGTSILGGLTTPSVVSEVRSCSSILETQGVSIVALLALPTALAAAGAAAIRVRMRVLVWVSAALLLIFSVLTGFSIGLYYIPSSILLLLAAALDAAPASPDPA